MLTKVFALVLVVLIGLALGVETARYVHTHATGVDASIARDRSNEPHCLTYAARCGTEIA